jgi:hypothetical protein
VRKLPWPLSVASSELTEHSDKGISNQRIYFIDQQDQRFWIVGSPTTQHFAKDAIRAILFERFIPDVIDKGIVQYAPGPIRKRASNRLHCCSHIFTRSLASLDITIHTAVRSVSIQIFHERQEC